MNRQISFWLVEIFWRKCSIHNCSWVFFIHYYYSQLSKIKIKIKSNKRYPWQFADNQPRIFSGDILSYTYGTTRHNIIRIKWVPLNVLGGFRWGAAAREQCNARLFSTEDTAHIYLICLMMHLETLPTLRLLCSESSSALTAAFTHWLA